MSYGSELSGNKDDIGLILLKAAEKNIVIKSRKYKIQGLSPDDIAQELRKKIWEVRHKYDPDRSSPQTFTSFVIKNYIKDLYKATQTEKRRLIKEGIPNYLKERLEDTEWQRKFIEHLDLLDPIWRG